MLSNKKTKTIAASAFFVTCMLILTSTYLYVPGFAGAGNEIAVYIEGTKLIVDVPPYIENGRTLVPMRAIFEGIGAQVSWDSATRRVTALRGKDEVNLVVDSKEAEVNGRVYSLDVPATIKNGRTMVPLRFVGESLGADVVWDGTDRSVTISFPDRPAINFYGSVKMADGTAAADIPLELVSGNFAGKGTSDARGSYSLRAFSTGEVRWWLSPASKEHVYYRYLIKGAKEGSSYELDFVLHPADAYVRGTVVDAEGDAVAGRALVATQGETGFGSHGTTDTDGGFSLPVSADKGRSWKIELQPGQERFYQKKNISISSGEDQQLSLEALTADARLEGQLKDENNNPLQNIYVVGETSKGYGVSFTDARGNFSIPVASSLSESWQVTAHLPDGLESKEIKISGPGNYRVNW